MPAAMSAGPPAAISTAMLAVLAAVCPNHAINQNMLVKGIVMATFGKISF